MDKSSFEEVLSKTGKLVYSNKGVSMMPLIRQGRDLIIIEPAPKGRLNRYDAPLFKRDNGEYVLHRVLKVKKDGYIMCGDHQWVKEYVSDDQIIGVLTAVVRDGKEISVNSKLYKLYVHIWCDLYPLRVMILKGKYYLRILKNKLKRNNPDNEK